MAVKPSNAALTALRNTRREKQNELVGAYTAMGGSDTALLAKPTIPKLESAINNLYQSAQSGGRDTYADRQAMSNAYNDYANSRTSDKLKHVKSESLAQLVSQPTIMGMSNAMYGNLTQDMKDAGLTLEDLERYNKAKSRQTYEDVANQIGADHPVIATGLAAAEQPLMSLGNVAKNVKNYALGNPIENNFNAGSALRNSVAENHIDSKVGNFAYGVGNSMVDMLIASLAGGNVGPAVMGLEKADEVMNNAVDRGLTPNQIMAEGAGSAITTALTERIPFKEFKAGNNIGRAMVSEGLQEGSEDIADTIVDILVTTVGGNPEKSEIARQYQAYLNMGMSEEDASKATVVDYLKQVGLDAVAGAIAGGGMGGINNVSQGYNFFRGNTNANTETNVDENVKADTEQTIPSLRDSRAEEANIQARREEELAQLTNAYSQIQQRQAEEQRRAEQLAREEEARNYDPETMEFLRSTLREANGIGINPTTNQQIPQVYRANPEDVVYHAGTLSRLNKAETNGRFSGSNRGTGYFGTGHYFVDNNTLNELENSGYKDKPLSSVDISGYTNLFRADTDAKANNLHNFLSDMTKFTQGSDKVSIEELYEEYTKAFDGEGNVMPYEDFVNRINGLTEYMKNSDMYDRGDSVSTQFMKSLGYGGVDTRGTRYADTRYGTVIYDLDENSVLQSNIPALQRASTDMLTRNENRNVFDAEEDARIQKILDDQAKKAKVDARFNEIYDNTELEQNEKKLEDLYKQRDDVQNVIYNINEALKDVDAYVRETEDFVRQFGFEGPTEEEHAEKVKETTADYTLSLESRQTELESINNQIADLEARNDALYEDVKKAYEQAREDVERSAEQKNGKYEAVPGLIYGTAHITDNYIDIDGYSNKKTEKGLLGDLAKAVSRYDEGEAQNLRDSVKWNEISQYPGNENNRDYILEWEDVPSASRNVDADGVDTVLSNRDDTHENFETESKPANYYVHIRFPKSNANLNEDIDNVKTLGEAEKVIGNEVEKLDNTLRMDLQFHSESNQTIPSVKDNGVHTGIYKDSKLATNTYPNSGVMTEEEFNRVIPDDVKQYETVTHEETLNAAEKNIKDNGYTGEYNRLIGKDKWNAVDVDTAMLCAMKAAEDARNAEALGIDPNEAWSREVEIFKNARSQATAGGQMIEAFKKWSALTAEGKLAQAISFVNEAVKEVKNENALPKDVKTAADRYLSDEVMAEFLKKAHQYDGQNPTLLQQARLNAELAHMINECIPVRFRNKFRSLWMDNLLASFRTLISRNFGGNIGKAALDQTLVKMISGPVDNFISRYTGTRTTTGFTREGLKTYAQGFKKGGKQTIKDYWTPNSDPDAELKLKDLAKDIEVFADANVTNRSGVDELNFKEAIRGNRTTFKNKAFKLYDKIIKFGLAIGDNPFYKGTYDQTVLELNTLREQGKLKLPEDITDAEFEQWVKVCATARGLEAVYQDNSELAQGAMDIKNGLAKVSNGFMGFDPLSNTAMPFVSTPMNVVKSNLELSPLGIVKNAAQTIKEIRSNLENGRTALDSQSFDQQRFVRETSRNIVGLLLFATGLMLKNAGYLTGGYSDDPKEAQAQKDAGMQEYALVSPFTGNQWSINWIPGLGSTFAAASAFDDAYSKPDQDTADALINGAKAGAQSLFEQAALQGLQRLTGSANYNSDNKIVDNVVQTIANTASSAIVPSIVRQSAAALDPYKRNTYGTGGKESVINNAIAGLPYLRTHRLEPRIGMNGQPIAQNAGRNTLEKWFDNLVNPAMVTVPSALANPVRDEATRLYEETKDSSAFQPKISLNYLAVDGHVPTTKEYTEFLQIADTAMNQIASDFIESPFYSTLTDEQRVDTLNDIYGTVQRVERAKYLGIDKDFDGADKAYFEGGAEGLTNYLTASTALNQLGLSNNDKNREAVLSALERNGSGSLPNIMSTYESNFDRAWQQLNIGGDIYNRYSGMTSFLNDEQYEDLANDMSSTIRTVEANRAIGYNREYTEAAKAYANGGVQGLVEYLYPATLLKQYGMDNNEKNRQGIMDAYNEGGANAVRSQLDAMQVFSGTAYGDGLNYRYNHATNYLPSLTPSQFASLYDTVDQQDKGTSGFNTITQQEVIDYLNRDPGAYNSETALQYWNAFDQHAGSDDQWKKIPVLVNGEWQAKKA